MGLLGMQTNTLSSLEKLRSTKNYFDLNDLFFVDISSWLRLPLSGKKLEGALHIEQTDNQRLKLVEVFSLKVLRNYF